MQCMIRTPVQHKRRQCMIRTFFHPAENKRRKCIVRTHCLSPVQHKRRQCMIRTHFSPGRKQTVHDTNTQLFPVPQSTSGNSRSMKHTLSHSGRHLLLVLPNSLTTSAILSDGHEVEDLWPRSRRPVQANNDRLHERAKS